MVHVFTKKAISENTKVPPTIRADAFGLERVNR